MQLVAELNHKISHDWVFIFLLINLAYLAYLKFKDVEKFLLVFKAPFSKKYTNQFIRQESRLSEKLFLLPLFSALLSMVVVSTSDYNLSEFFYYFLVVLAILFVKYLFIQYLAVLFKKKYLFEEIIFHSFLYERFIGLVLLPLFLSFTFSDFSKEFILNIVTVFLFLMLVYKLSRMTYYSFFNTSFSKAHIIIYLCTLEILPVIILSKNL